MLFETHGKTILSDRDLCRVVVITKASKIDEMLVNDEYVADPYTDMRRGNVRSREPTDRDFRGFCVVGREGIGPSTLGLKGPCSTTELPTLTKNLLKKRPTWVSEEHRLTVPFGYGSPMFLLQPGVFHLF